MEPMEPMEQAEQVERAERQGQARRTEQAEQAGRAERTERTDRAERVEQTGRAERAERAERPQIQLKPISEELRDGCLSIFNQIIDEGETFPFDTSFSRADFDAKYVPEEPVWCAINNSGDVLGFVHIHPNNIGRCSHIANCGYSVAREYRGLGIGRKLVAKSIEVAKDLGFTGIQFNAVVSTNAFAIALYQSFGFKTIGTIPGGFRLGTVDNPVYVDMHIMFLELP